MALAAETTPGNADAGAEVFRMCMPCHQIGAAAQNGTGPILNGILGAAAGAVDGFDGYSKAMQDLAASGHVWTAEALSTFLTDPRVYLPGTRMTFPGLESPQDRADVIAYLGAVTIIEDEPGAFMVAPEILAIKGDAAFGEYLAGECVTCHKLKGPVEGIPNVLGLDRESFVAAMHAYRAGVHDHPVMRMIAGRLNDQEIAALAAYFAGLGKD